jgi:hypothetical protein
MVNIFKVAIATVTTVAATSRNTSFGDCLLCSGVDDEVALVQTRTQVDSRRILAESKRTSGFEIERRRAEPDRVTMSSNIDGFDEAKIEDFDFEFLAEPESAAMSSNTADLDAAKIEDEEFEDIDGHCADKIARLDSLGQQDLTNHVGNDPQFPPTLDSLCAPGESMEDVANKKLGQSSCSKYNNWKDIRDMDQIAKQNGKDFTVFSKVEFHDIGQGVLGSCYFLAAVAAVAYNHPEVIEDMFVERNLWSNGIYKTKWLVNGEKIIVSVDGMVPANPKKNLPWFAQPSTTGEWWPVILAKAWAKIYGTFGAIRGGIGGECVAAITRAPVINLAHQDISRKHKASDPEDIWKKLEAATTNAYPVTAGTTELASKYGLANPHSYCVLEVKTMRRRGRVVRLFNPWREAYYKGAVPNDEAVNGVQNRLGEFTMLFTEYLEAFKYTEINKLHAGYKAHSIKVDVDLPKAFEVTAPPGVFYASITWPGWRMVDPCPVPNPRLDIITGAKRKELARASRMMSHDMPNYDSVSTRLENINGGKYEVFESTTFSKRNSYIREITVTVYGPPGSTIKISKIPPQELALDMLGPTADNVGCDVILVADMETGLNGIFVEDDDKLSPTGSGVPTYWSPDKTKFVYYPGGKETQWFATRAVSYQQILQAPGKPLSYAKLDKTEIKCGCQDNAGKLEGWDEHITCENVVPGKELRKNVKCEGTKSSIAVKQLCPKTCGLCSTDHHALRMTKRKREDKEDEEAEKEISVKQAEKEVQLKLQSKAQQDQDKATMHEEHVMEDQQNAEGRSAAADRRKSIAQQEIEQAKADQIEVENERRQMKNKSGDNQFANRVEEQVEDQDAVNARMRLRKAREDEQRAEHNKKRADRDIQKADHAERRAERDTERSDRDASASNYSNSASSNSSRSRTSTNSTNSSSGKKSLMGSFFHGMAKMGAAMKKSHEKKKKAHEDAMANNPAYKAWADAWKQMASGVNVNIQGGQTNSAQTPSGGS